MAKIKTHIEDCERVLGKGHEEIHRWMDELAKKWKPYHYLEYHRQFRHHDEAVKYIEKKWGWYASQAARLHIIRDNEMYLPMPVMDIMREDQIQELYEKALHYCHPVNKGWENVTLEHCK
jgi:hypothetical protein